MQQHGLEVAGLSQYLPEQASDGPLQPAGLANWQLILR